MVDERTSHFNLPLPHSDNLLSEDVERIRQAMSEIDAALHHAQAQLASAIAAEQTARQAMDQQLLALIAAAL